MNQSTTSRSSDQAGSAGIDSTALFDPLAPDFIDNPYAHYARLRETDPVHFHSTLGMWLVSRYDDIQGMLRQPRLGCVEERFFGNCPPGSDVDKISRSWLFFLNPPEHTRVRRLFTATFAPRRVESVRQSIRAVVDTRLDALEAAGGGDFIRMVAQDLPIAVICSMMGIPDVDLEDCTRHSSAMVKLLDPLISPDELTQAEKGASWALGYFGDLIAERRRNRQGDLISALVEINDENPDRLSDEELVNNVVFLFGAGHETTTSMLGNGLHALLTHPGQWARLRQEPSLIGNAVSEILRWDSSVQYFSRKVLEDMELSGRRLREGDVVMGLIGSANRDPRKFACPDDFDIERDNGQLLSFGGGVHYCIGAMLARIEAETALSAIIDRFPGMQVAAPPRRRKMLAVRGYEELRVGV